ncbi:FG-GAP-like repeat-containing protein [Streptomyces sp. NPDC050421]|uniref:FG-GAP-like repeat-containing protein n=1 Tax=Streptomyces sp. NPDC050421 TaxID=3365613 RepID=UPI0037A08FCE
MAAIAAMGPAGILSPISAAAAPVTSVPQARTAADVPLDDGSVSEEDKALAEAKATGNPAEVISARTEISDTWAQPDGSFSVLRHSSPVRLLRDGTWLATDPSLAFAADGTVVPKAATVDVAFSGGGAGPLLSGVKDGRTLTLSWPTELPKPVLDGNVATYTEILPGVDLQLKAEVAGFSQLLVVKTAEAAKNPELATLKFKMQTVGLTVSADAETGSVTALNPAGQTVFTSPTPLMWDSTKAVSAPAGRAASVSAAEESTPGDAFEPPPGATDAQMPTTVSDDSLEIKPDQALLSDTNTTYPVYIDPSWAWGDRDTNWTRVYQKYPGSSFWNANEVARVGYENETDGLSRSFFQIDTDDIRKVQVKSSTFRIKNVWSWSCQARPVELFQTKSISKKTTWKNQPSKLDTSPLDTVNDAKGWSKDCGAGSLEFDVTTRIRDAAEKGWSNITLGMYAGDESDTFGWKKFDAKTAVLETVYNNYPYPPQSLGTNPKTSCTSGGIIGNTKVSLHATVDDKDGGNLTAEFKLFKTGSTTPVVSTKLAALKKRAVTLPLADADVPSGDYTWNVRAIDHAGASSAVSTTCKFTVDRARPGKPPVITSVDYPDGANGWPAATGQARTPGKFTLDPNGVTDAVSYVWYTDYDPELNTIDVAAGAKATVTITPPGYGPHFAYAYSVDKAGNRSDTATYLYYATRRDQRDLPGDLNGDDTKDIWSIDSNGTLLTYAGQQDGDFSSATNGGQAFDGADITYRSDWGQDGYNDLITLEPDQVDQRKKLWKYTNNGNGIATTDFNEGKQQLSVKCPVVDEDYGCTEANDHWTDASQIVAPGSIDTDTNPDLLVRQGKLLYVYYGNRTTRLSTPVLVGGNDWDKYTILAPGDLNDDGLPDLWLRDTASGDIYRANGSLGPNGKLNLATWGNPASRVKIASGYPARTYPVLSTIGDITGDGVPDLWGRKTDNTMNGWRGQVSGTSFTFSGTFPIDGITGGTRIVAGTTISAGQSYTSRSAELTMRDDGNLVITSHADNVLWQSKTAGNPGATALMQHDGNLVVLKAEDSSILWQSGTTGAEGYALLQDRGNLVVNNAKSQGQWSSGTAIRHDYNGDGRSDMANWYDYAEGEDKIRTFVSNSDGTFQAPGIGYEKPAGSWWAEHMKFVTGDYNGDGRGDVAAFYGYDEGNITLYTWLSKADGTFSPPFTSWKSKPGNWTWARIKVQSGDFNGDGRDDIATWYDYADGADKLYTFTANVRGGFNSPFPSFYRANGWTASNMKFATGDYNGDGRDDIGAFYGYDKGNSTLFTFTAQPNGGFAEPLSGWESGSWGSIERTSVYSGDFNGDGRDDIATWYDYADGHDAVISFNPSAEDGTFGNRTEIWKANAGIYSRNLMQIVTGDYNGDGRDDIGAFCGYDEGAVKTITWIAKADGTLNEPIDGWKTAPGNWTFDRVTFFERYNS